MAETGFLSDRKLKLLIESQGLVSGINKENLQPSSIDLNLGNRKYNYKLKKYILGEPFEASEVIREEFDSFELKHGESANVVLSNEINMPKTHLGIVVPRSSITRLGINVSTLYINPGYKGKPPICLTNLSGIDIVVTKNIRIAQLLVATLDSAPSVDYSGKKGSKYFEEDMSYSKMFNDEEIKEIIDTFLPKRSD